MIFKVRELSGTEPLTSIRGVDHEYDYLDQASTKMKLLEDSGVGTMLTLWMGGVSVDANPICNAIKGEARSRLHAEWLPSYVGLKGEEGPAFVAYLNGEGAQRKIELQREVTDAMAGRF